MQIVSEFGFSPLCISTLGIRNRASVPSSTGINCQPCSTPVVSNRCCCNCWRVEWPGFSFTGTNPNAVPTGPMTFDLVIPDGNLGSQEQCHVVTAGVDEYCGWKNVGYTGTFGAVAGATLRVPTPTNNTYYSLAISIPNAANTDRLGFGYANLPIDPLPMKCSELTLYFGPPLTISFQPAGMTTVTVPSSMTITPIPCP